ncbi:MAG: TIGR04282 family arsenosugar biosynthesis glycosyltransferase [Candidatus Scalindua sediminis]|nr:TIGR04282 family arsenosugar biosynthesis glycosyltransferase [Candidatus Scalindua sediminis]
MSACLVVFVKDPIPGRVKTRLTPRITPDEAAKLYKAFTIDIISNARKLKRNSVNNVTVAYTPIGAEKAFRKLVKQPTNFLPQKGKNLGERMKNAFKQSFAEGAKRVVIIGTDSPTLPVSYIQKAFDILKKIPIVIGPTFDGGYYLIGLSGLNDDIFDGIGWSTSRVFDQTLTRIKSLNTQVYVLPPWYDVDTSEDLEFLRTHLLAMRMSGVEEVPERTMQLLKI